MNDVAESNKIWGEHCCYGSRTVSSTGYGCSGVMVSGKNGGEKMRYAGTLICVDNIERSKRFYSDLFNLNVEVDNGENVMLTEFMTLTGI